SPGLGQRARARDLPRDGEVGTGRKATAAGSEHDLPGEVEGGGVAEGAAVEGEGAGAGAEVGVRRDAQRALRDGGAAAVGVGPGQGGGATSRLGQRARVPALPRERAVSPSRKETA